MEIGIPLDYMVWCGNVVNKMQLGFSYKKADAAQIAKQIHIPTIVMNSKVDQTTPYFMGKDIYDNLSSSQKELWTVSDSEHVGMWLDYNEKYRSKVLDFIQD